MVIRFPLIEVGCSIVIIILILVCLTPKNSIIKGVIQINEPSGVTIIIDAGHGGTDGGAIGADGSLESEINLQIAKKLELLCKLFGASTKMTRVSDSIDYPSEAVTISEKKIADQKQRLRLIRDCHGGILLSIHQNSFPTKDVSGIQVLYGHDNNSRVLGEIMQKELNLISTTGVWRSASEVPDSIYLMRECACTAVLIECGFISNSAECSALQLDDYQKKLVMAIYSGCVQYLNQ